jgi:hypothetical protein
MKEYKSEVTRQEFEDLKCDVKDLHKIFDKITDIDDTSYAMAYQDQTNISQNNEDRPFIMSASTIKDMKTLEDRITALEQSISL